MKARSAELETQAKSFGDEVEMLAKIAGVPGKDQAFASTKFFELIREIRDLAPHPSHGMPASTTPAGAAR